MTTPSHQWLTLGFLAFMVIAVVAFDIIVCLLVGADASISRVLLRFSLQHQIVVPIVCFIVGVLVGHIFLPQYVR